MKTETENQLATINRLDHNAGFHKARITPVIGCPLCGGKYDYPFSKLVWEALLDRSGFYGFE